MSRYTEKALEMRSRMTPEGRPVYGCCQTVVSAFAQDLGYDEEACLKAATYFRGGMQSGSVCGAVTGGLMALGLAGLRDPAPANEFILRFREAHGDMMECAGLLEDNAARGGEKLPFCNALICEAISLAEEILRENGAL